MEDGLKKLDKLTHEEARMAIAENLKATHAVDDRVKGVVDQVGGVDARVANIDDGVKGVNDRVTVVIDGAQTVFSSSKKPEETRAAVQQAANNVDQVKRS